MVYPLIRALLRGLRKAYAQHFANYEAPEIYAELIFKSVYLALADVGPGPTLREVREAWLLSKLWLEPDLNSLKEALGVGTTRESRRG
ncbi:hypothetical protein [Acidihalobacter ferrooxydans]|uniref:Uncharacterized protein n=1 Tax=Acidihalobacter ferrooxydans TaxID=1765967 RepID=A0A1P8UIH7_9GAMM|nr:hypothetical protein [Acidihalobacter ferrooxydans]APZ43604.1 hypothetical protein BW247_11330 [Acidihalobacter ferrooxydans]